MCLRRKLLHHQPHHPSHKERVFDVLCVFFNLKKKKKRERDNSLRNHSAIRDICNERNTSIYVQFLPMKDG